MYVISLFDGISCGRVALERAGIKVTRYVRYEIDKHANKKAQENWPMDESMGDVCNWREHLDVLGVPDLIIGGSPCQGFSFSGKQLAFDDPRSKLFFVFADMVNHFKAANPDLKFMLENVQMKKQYLQVITDTMGVQPVKINSALVSAQNRVRYYWANWEFGQPEDKGILLRDILLPEDEVTEEHYLGAGQINRLKTSTDLVKCFSKIDPDKALCMTARQYANWKGTFVTVRQKARGNNKGFERGLEKSPSMTSSNWQHNNHIVVIGGEEKLLRRLTPVECERLQTLPDDYTAGMSKSQRYRALGNGWTVDVIAHILRGIVS